MYVILCIFVTHFDTWDTTIVFHNLENAMKNFSFFTLLVLAVLSITLSSCGNKKSSADKQKEPYTLSLGAMPSMDYLPFVVAQKTGIYDSLGLKLEIVKFYSPNERDAAFHSGNVEGTVIDYTGAAMQQAGGIDLQLVMRLDGYFRLVMSKDYTGESLETLKGKNLGISRNTVIEYTTDRIINTAGLDESEITKTEVNKIPLRLEMLRSGQIDAAVLPDPFITIAMADGMMSLVSTQDLGIFVTGAMFAGSVIREKQEAIDILLRGYDLAVDYILSHDRKAIRNILIEDVGVPEPLADDVILPDYTHGQKPTIEDLQQTIDWLHAKKLVPSDYTGKDLIR
ncbi:ABC transporter substrate-binding protein [Porphyromonas gingivalis]|nr:ABC transporter substrate-binding protein [Porphyromonas gingivalis]